MGLWFSSCTDSNCKNVLVKSTPLSVDDEDDDEDEDAAAAEDLEAVGVAGGAFASARWTRFALLYVDADVISRRPGRAV